MTGAGALAIFALVLAVAAVFVWRRPVVALYLFVVGLAAHNAVMAALYGAGLHGSVLSIIILWKEALLGVGLARVTYDAVRMRRLPFRPIAADWLALAFLLLIGVVLVADGVGQHISKGYIYFAMAFSLFVEILNLRARAKRTPPVKLHQQSP